MEAHEQGQEAVEQDEACAKACVCDYSEECAQDVNARDYRQKQHGGYAADEGEIEEEFLSEPAVVGGAAHANNQQSLYEDGYAERVHGETGRVDFNAEDVDYTLSLFRAWFEQAANGRGG